jgi:hypothetical protein
LKRYSNATLKEDAFACGTGTTVCQGPATKDRLEKAAAHLNLDSTSEYVESAILAQLKKDKIE